MLHKGIFPECLLSACPVCVTNTVVYRFVILGPCTGLCFVVESNERVLLCMSAVIGY